MKSFIACCALAFLSTTWIIAASACAPSLPSNPHGISSSLAVGKRWAAPGSPVELSYRFDVAEDGAPFVEDHEIFVHFLDAAGDTVFTDDHAPPVPTTSWAPGSTIRYPRTIFVPHNAEAGSTTIELGLREPETGAEIRLVAAPSGRLEFGRLQIDPQERLLPLSYTRGWYGLETDADDPGIQWRWTEFFALSTFPHPGSDAVIYLHASTNAATAREPVEVTVKVGPGYLQVARFRVERPGPFLERIYVPQTLMGGLENVELYLDVDKTIVPAAEGPSADQRRLGLQVFNLEVEPSPDALAYFIESMNPLVLESPATPYQAEYVFTEEWDWFTPNIPVWAGFFEPFKGRPDIHYLEVGVFEGRSYAWMAENIFTHPTSTMTGVDVFTGHEHLSGEEVKARFLENVRRAGVADRSSLYQGFSQLEMRKLPLDFYDIIYIDAAHDAANVLEDAMLARRLLKAGGIVIFDDYEWPNPGVKHAADTFLQIYGDEYTILHRGYQLILKKGERF